MTNLPEIGKRNYVSGFANDIWTRAENYGTLYQKLRGTEFPRLTVKYMQQKRGRKRKGYRRGKTDEL